MLMRIFRYFFLTTLVLAFSAVYADQALAQSDLSNFTSAFQIFQNAQDAYKTFNISPDDVIYSLPPSYTIGSGDILQVVMTGMINDSLVVQVGPQGDVYVPPAGLEKVDGMTVQAARDYIDGEMSKYLKNYQLGLQLLRARRINVYLLGQVRQPGTYIALAGTTALSVIETAGTLVQNPMSATLNETNLEHPYFRALTSGAGRKAEVWRKNQLVATVDLAQMAVNGKVENDVILQDGDALFIPPNERPVVVRGGVSRPGTYEVQPDDTVFDVLAQAGGYKSMMMLGSVEVERPNPSGTPGSTVTTLDLGKKDFNPHSFVFQPGDILRVPEVKQKVYVLGGVWMAQAIDYHEGWTALDYLASAGGPVMASSTKDIRIISAPLASNQQIVPFNFKNLVQGRPVETIPIEPGDMIWVPFRNVLAYGGGLTNTIAIMLGQVNGIARLIHDMGW